MLGNGNYHNYIILSLIRESENKRKKKKEIEKEREFVFNQGQILIWHVLARAIKYNHQKAHHLFSLLCFRTPPPFFLLHRNQHPFSFPSDSFSLSRIESLRERGEGEKMKEKVALATTEGFSMWLPGQPVTSDP